jgi:hypothetical protein
LEIDNFPEITSLPTRQMIFSHSIHSMHVTSAASAGSYGFVWESSVNRRPMLANLRKESVARPDGIVIG